MNKMRMTAELLDKPFSQMTREERATAVDYADSIKRADYFRAVTDIADEAKDEIHAGNITDAEELDTWLSESVDGSHWVIYTYANFEVLRWSENHDAYMEDFGEVPTNGRDSLKWPALAYAALLADVREELGDFDALFDSDEQITTAD